MKTSKWYLVQGETKFGNYAIIKEESTDNFLLYRKGWNSNFYGIN